MAHPKSVDISHNINGLTSQTCPNRPIEIPCVLLTFPNLGDAAEKGKAAATAIANGFKIQFHDHYSVSDSHLQEVAG